MRTSGPGILVLQLLLLFLFDGILCQKMSYNERLILCALDKAPCDNLGNQIRDILPQIIGRNCEECSQKQKRDSETIINFVRRRYPLAWKALVHKYSYSS